MRRVVVTNATGTRKEANALSGNQRTGCRGRQDYL